MRRTLIALLAMALATTAAPAAAYAASGADGDTPDISIATYTVTGLPGHPDLHHGTVLDVTFGRERGAFERHQVVGAAPSFSYGVVADIFFASACSPDDPFGAFPFPEGQLVTDRHGNGSFRIDFPGDAFATAPDTFWVEWRLMAGSDSAYSSSCVQVEL